MYHIHTHRSLVTIFMECRLISGLTWVAGVYIEVYGKCTLIRKCDQPSYSCIYKALLVLMHWCSACSSLWYQLVTKPCIHVSIASSLKGTWHTSLFQNKLLSLQESADQGEQLKRDQEEAIAKLGEVQLQLDLVKDLQKQFSSLNTEVNVYVHVHVYTTCEQDRVMYSSGQ